MLILDDEDTSMETKLLREKIHLGAAFVILVRGTISILYIVSEKTRMIIKFVIECIIDSQYYLFIMFIIIA